MANGLLDMVIGEKMANALRQYVSDSMPGGLLNPETPKLGGLLNKGANELASELRAYGATNKAALDDPSWDNVKAAVGANMAAAGMAPMGMIAYHGSPHKFDKFSLDKIGTGEGAQAYGHGLYLAEAPEVARTYSADRAYVGAAMQGNPIAMNYDDPAWIAQKTIDELGDPSKAKAHLEMVQRTAARFQPPETKEAVQGAIDMIASGSVARKGNLYKTDIPDEAVARFLDWDKPLSQQAPEVQAAFRKHVGDSQFNAESAWNMIKDKTGGEAYQTLAGRNQHLVSGGLADQGIPGIRYLDGGSRSTGQGTSNFVAFDPEMIRILERNGQTTGAQPWKPGEWK
jgi:hypothetical protein